MPAVSFAGVMRTTAGEILLQANGGRMKAIAVTDVGKKRTMNQDYVFLSKDPVGNLPNLFIVADGMGGHKAGDFASRYAVNLSLIHI